MPARGTTSPAISGRSQYTPLISGGVAGLGVDVFGPQSIYLLSNHGPLCRHLTRTVELVVDPIRIVWGYLFFSGISSYVGDLGLVSSEFYTLYPSSRFQPHLRAL